MLESKKKPKTATLYIKSLGGTITIESPTADLARDAQDMDNGDALELVTTVEGDATVAGASQLATFQLQSSTIKALLPSLQNLAVGTYGVNVSQEQMIQTGNLVGYGVLPVITSAVNFLASKIPDAQNAMTKAVETVKVPIVWIKDNALPPLITTFQNAWNYGVSAFDSIKTAVMQNSEKFSGIITIAGGVKDALFNAFEFCKPVLNWIKDTGLPLMVNALAGVVQKATDVYNFFVNNWGWIAPVISGIVGAIVAFKIAVFAINTVMNAWAIVQGICTVAQWALNVAMTANPVGIIIVAIGALIAIGVALWMNWDSVCAWCKQAFQAVGIPAIPTFTAPQIPMLANGGLIRTAGTVIVGEKGPEILSLPSGAKVSPIDKSRRSENNFYINIYADGKSADEIVDELMPKLKLSLANL